MKQALIIYKLSIFHDVIKVVFESISKLYNIMNFEPNKVSPPTRFKFDYIMNIIKVSAVTNTFEDQL